MRAGAVPHHVEAGSLEAACAKVGKRAACHGGTVLCVFLDLGKWKARCTGGIAGFGRMGACPWDQ